MSEPRWRGATRSVTLTLAEFESLPIPGVPLFLRAAGIHPYGPNLSRSRDPVTGAVTFTQIEGGPVRVRSGPPPPAIELREKHTNQVRIEGRP